MGKKVLKQAQKLGFTNFRKTVLYGRPRKIKMTFSKYVPDTDRAIRDYIEQTDPNFAHDRSGGGRNNSYYIIAPEAKIYVEALDKAAGFAVVNPANHAIQFNIYTDSDEHLRGIARAINSRWEDGILAHMDWPKIEKKYKVNRDDVTAAWNAVL